MAQDKTIDIKPLQDEIAFLKKQLSDFKDEFRKHQHYGNDGSDKLTGNIELDDRKQINIGDTGITATTEDRNSSADRRLLLLISGEKGGGWGRFTPNTQVNIEHQPFAQGGKESFIYTFRGNAYSGSASITSGGNTLTDTSKSWATDEFISSNATPTFVNVYDSTGAFQQCKAIDSHTATVLTITGTWNFDDANATYIIWRPVYFGSAGFPYKRLYTTSLAGGGVRFGEGPSGVTTGILYMDAAGDLYWKYAGGAAVKLN